MGDQEKDKKEDDVQTKREKSSKVMEFVFNDITYKKNKLMMRKSDGVKLKWYEIGVENVSRSDLYSVTVSDHSIAMDTSVVQEIIKENVTLRQKKKSNDNENVIA